MFGVLKPFLWYFGQLFSHKKEWGHLLERDITGNRIHYTSRSSITQELLQLLDEFSFSYLFLLAFSTTYSSTGWHRLKMSEMVLRYLYEKQFL